VGQSLDSSDHPPRKKTRGYETSREENLDSIRPEQPFGTANLPPSRARATTFAFILDKSEPSSQLIRTAVEKYFIVVKLNVAEKNGKHPELENPGGEELAAKFGGADATGRVHGVPFIVLLDATGEPIVSSYRPVQGRPIGANIGYPDKPEEINWFMTMMKKAVPAMAAEEQRSIEEWLQKASASAKNESYKSN
jgi:hypothetical protein